MSVWIKRTLTIFLISEESTNGGSRINLYFSRMDPLRLKKTFMILKKVHSLKCAHILKKYSRWRKLTRWIKHTLLLLNKSYPHGCHKAFSPNPLQWFSEAHSPKKALTHDVTLSASTSHSMQHTLWMKRNRTVEMVLNVAHSNKANTQISFQCALSGLYLFLKRQAFRVKHTLCSTLSCPKKAHAYGCCE